LRPGGGYRANSGDRRAGFRGGRPEARRRLWARMRQAPASARRVDEYRRTDGRGYVKTRKGDFLCAETISEFVISLLVADILKRRMSVNFIDTFYFGVCNKRGRSSQYTFMEKIDGDLDKVLDRLSRNDVNSIYIQIIHSIATYQKLYKIVHGDLHEGNLCF